MKFGVVRFPGSCDDVDALLAARRVGEAELLWHADADLRGVDAVIVPGGFSYGDYLRCGAIARFAPLMGEVERFARHGGLVLGICNGFQVLCEAGLLSGALLPNTSLRFVCRQVGVEVVNASTAWTGACSPGDRLSIPAKHTTGRFWAPDPVLDELEANGQVVLRYAAGENFNGSSRDIAGISQRRRQRRRPDAASGARGRSADRLRRRAAAVPLRRPGSRVSKHRELGLTDSEYDLIVDKLGREPNQVELAVFSLMWSEHCGYKHSRRLLKTLPTEGPRLVLGPGENAGAVSVGEGLACAFKVESHNHPSAVEPFEGAATGVGGILRDIFAIGARPIAVLDSLRFGEVGELASLALPARARGGGDRPLRQLDRGRDRRRRDLLRGPVRAELPRQRDVRRADRDRPADPVARRPASATSSCCSARAPAATGSAARRCWRRPSSTSPRTSGRRCRSATRSRRRSCSSARWSCSSAGCWSRCRTSARRA